VCLAGAVTQPPMPAKNEHPMIVEMETGMSHRRRRRRHIGNPRSTPRPSLRSVWVASTVDSAEHAVTDTDMAAGRCHGEYSALCGAQVAPAPLIASSSRRCQRCVSFVRAWATLRDLATETRTQHRHRGWLSRWRHG
jgi:hypothetical protein